LVLQLEGTVSKSTAETNREIAYSLSNSLPRLLREFSRDFDHLIHQGLSKRGYGNIRAAHSTVFSNLGMGAVRVTELAQRARVTQQAMGKMLKELERMGYIARDIDSSDKRAREIRLTESGIELAHASAEVIAQVRQLYAQRIGEQELNDLEARLRSAMASLNLDYLPETWLDQQVSNGHNAHRNGSQNTDN
jgi:DNA-binding MarR family transcriptional regulator